MHKSRQAVSGNTFSKIVLGLAAVLLLFAPPTARSGGAAEVYDFQICHGYFALCAASTCTPTGKQITVKTATGGTATFPEADCTCPVVLGPSIANLAGGNMQGSCEPPRPDTIWSTYQPDRTFHRRSPTGCRRQHRRFFARSASVSEINWSTALAS